MTRAVVELANDVTCLMPAMPGVIEGCGYHPEGSSLGFHFEDMSVVLEARCLTIIGADSEAKARRLIDWLDARARLVCLPPS